VRRALICFFLLIASAAVAQYRPGTGNPDVQFVPWKFLTKGTDLVKGPFVVYWLPESLKETEHSPLFSSNVLLEDAARCVDFQIVTPDDAVNIARLAKPPAALILNSEGHVVRQVNTKNPKAIEAMVTAELALREDQVLRDLARAKKEKSVELYKKIWDDRCLYPLIGTEAQRGLKELGVIVSEPPSTLTPDPNLKVTKPTKKP
jgi:hypothetical protein